MQLQKIKIAKTMSHCRYSPNVQLTGELKIRLADFKFSIMCQSFNSVRPCTLLNSSLYANCARYTVSVQTSWAFIPRPSLDAIHFRQGWRADKAITSFHKNRIFVKTRKVMGNTDIAHYRGQLATTLSSFCFAKTRHGFCTPPSLAGWHGCGSRMLGFLKCFGTWWTN